MQTQFARKFLCWHITCHLFLDKIRTSICLSSTIDCLLNLLTLGLVRPPLSQFIGRVSWMGWRRNTMHCTFARPPMQSASIVVQDALKAPKDASKSQFGCTKRPHHYVKTIRERPDIFDCWKICTQTPVWSRGRRRSNFPADIPYEFRIALLQYFSLQP